ncbi:Fimbrial adapter PapK [Edwardsiella anguillarum]|nr:fimbrial adapter papK [Edwardsiella piscicida]RFT02360.1 type 1 fimbrial protein [Edwardsiella anguillarum]ELM3656988.1 type 1 fimbrial protein [Edwardsiella piscicida]ELM3735291.1 type 1 fimbrial protein [Edwardsiella piscicida]QBB13519.1 type 1 fimbrial protein [Edwardsiella piscicida]
MNRLSQPMLQIKRVRGVFYSISIVLLLAGTAPVNAVDMNFSGELLERPCEISQESLVQEVGFLTRPVRDFWVSPGKGPATGFSIKLINCNTASIARVVKLKFSGTREPNMLGQADYFLRVNGVNQGRLAIGILDTDGKMLLKLGDAHNHQQGNRIDENTILLNFKAFVQATPDAVRQKNVSPGDYSSVAGFELFYE